MESPFQSSHMRWGSGGSERVGVGGHCSLTFTSFSDLSTCPNKGFSKNKDSKGWLEKSPWQSQGCHPGITSLTTSSEIMTPSLVFSSCCPDNGHLQAVVLPGISESRWV